MSTEAEAVERCIRYYKLSQLKHICEQCQLVTHGTKANLTRRILDSGRVTANQARLYGEEVLRRERIGKK